jgi:hypothetical protein
VLRQAARADGRSLIDSTQWVARALQSMGGGVLAFVWLAGLWYAAPLLDAAERDVADRLRNALVLGVAIPFALAFAGILWGASAFAVLGGACLARRRYRRERIGPPPRALLGVVTALVFFAWPQLVHPLLEGDSLAYHLPNAVAWAQAHSIWRATAREWFYPGASELFAAPFVAFGARWSLPACGSVAAVLIVARITLWGRELGARIVDAGLCALACVATPIAAFEVGTLQNDLWLAAFFLETLYVLRNRFDWKAAALTSLLKPVGFVYAAIAILVTRRFDARVLLAFVPLALWIARDALLLAHADVPVEPPPDYWATAIASNVPATLELLTTGLRTAGFAVPLLVALPFAGLALPEIRSAALGGSLAAVVYVFLPYGFAGSVNFIAAGTSFRFALPAMACGALVLCALCVRVRGPAVGTAVVIALLGGVAVATDFWSDGWAAPVALGLTPLCVGAVALDRSRRRSVASAIPAFVLVASAPFAAVRAEGFFADWMRGPNGAPTQVFAWLAAHGPRRVVVWSVRAGSVFLMSPRTRVIEASAADPCETARAARALLLVGTDRDSPAEEQAQRRTVARACGALLYADGAALVVEPK